MPARRIPKNHLVVTGRHASARSADGSADFESTLEKEHMLLLDFDTRVERYEAQPVRIEVGGSRHYTPDLLVTFGADTAGVRPSPELVEVKTRADLVKHAAAYRDKFEAARIYAEQRGWRFLIRTEVDIRTPRLEAVKFLRRYRSVEPAIEHAEVLLQTLRSQQGRCAAHHLVECVTNSDDERALLYTALWHLVATRQIMLDMDAGIRPDSPLWLGS